MTPSAISPLSAQAAAGSSLSAEQQVAVDERFRDVLVVAGAGTGKTTTLTARYLSLLAEGVDLRSIVAVTFTRRAAREMRNRIRSEIARRSRNPAATAEERAQWNGRLSQMDAARISTIHSLCSEILEAHPVEAEIEPGFATLEDADSQVLRADIVAETMEWATADASFAPLFSVIKVASLRKVIDFCLKHRLDIGDMANPGSLARARTELTHACEAFVLDPEAHEAVKKLRLAWAFSESMPQAQADDINPAFAENIALLPFDLNGTPSAESTQVAANLLRFLANVAQNGVKENWKPHNPKANVKALKARAAACFDCSVKEVERLSPLSDLALLDALPHLRTIIDDALRRYAKAKSAIPALDFDDLEERTLHLLARHDDVRDFWRGRVAALLVDEYQDSNPRQVQIFQHLASRPGQRFSVGDPRQSIYAFRGANPATMADEMTRLEAQGMIAQVTVSHRAHSALLASVNQLAAHLFPDQPGVSLRATDRLPDAHMTPPHVQMLLVKGTKEAGADDAAARALANRLWALHDAGVGWDQIAILCRRRAAIAAYENALEKVGIPYESVVAAGLYSRPEVRDALNALAALNDPTDNLALFGALRSPGMGLDDGMLYRMLTPEAWPDALGEQRNPHQQHARQPAPQPGALRDALRSADSPEARRAYDTIDKLRREAGRIPVAIVLQHFLDETGLMAALVRAGRQRAARNLGKLVDDALLANSVDIGGYLDDVRRRRSLDVREEEAPADAENAVRLMTLHAAKGLEFPVVVLGDASADEPSVAGPLVDAEYGLLFVPDRREGKPWLYHNAAKRNAGLEKEEGSRILYVAATRARELLIVNGAYSDGPAGWLAKLCAAFGIASDVKAAEPTSQTPIVFGASGVHCEVLALDSPLTQVSLRDLPADSAFHAEHAPSIETTGPDPRMILPVGTPRPIHVPSRTPTVSGAPAAMVVGTLVHNALAAWRFPSQPDFARWLQGRIGAENVDPAGAHRIEQRVRLLLGRFQSSAVFAECDTITDRQTELAVVYGDGETDQPTLSGRIDLLYRRGGGQPVVVDFKTDHYPTRAAMESAAQGPYASQIRRYGRAVQAAIGQQPELILCFLDVDGAAELVSIGEAAPAA